jgi:hypothetical protein
MEPSTAFNTFTGWLLSAARLLTEGEPVSAGIIDLSTSGLSLAPQLISDTEITIIQPLTIFFILFIFKTNRYGFLEDDNA